MQIITNPTRATEKASNEALRSAKEWVTKCGLGADGYAPEINYAYGYLRGKLTEAYAVIANLQKELDKPRCEECGSDCVEIITKDSVFGEATILHCESCAHESEPF